MFFPSSEKGGWRVPLQKSLSEDKTMNAVLTNDASIKFFWSDHRDHCTFRANHCVVFAYVMICLVGSILYLTRICSFQSCWSIIFFSELPCLCMQKFYCKNYSGNLKSWYLSLSFNLPTWKAMSVNWTKHWNNQLNWRIIVVKIIFLWSTR